MFQAPVLLKSNNQMSIVQVPRNWRQVFRGLPVKDNVVQVSAMEASTLNGLYKRTIMP